jgi:hypothetical protein
MTVMGFACRLATGRIAVASPVGMMLACRSVVVMVSSSESNVRRRIIPRCMPAGGRVLAADRKTLRQKALREICGLLLWGAGSGIRIGWDRDVEF